MTSPSAPTSFPNQAPAYALVMAAGSGLRARRGKEQESPKQFQLLGKRQLAARSLEALASHPEIVGVVLVMPANAALDDKPWRDYVPDNTKLILTHGGNERRESVRFGLEALDRTGFLVQNAKVLVHDGARPFVDHEMIDRLLAALEAAPGAVPTLPVTDTLKQVVDGELVSGPDRSALAAVQTPQAFAGRLLLDAHRAVAQSEPETLFTDDASVMEWAGHPSIGVAGSPDAIKITTPTDWERAEQVLVSRNLKSAEKAMTPTESRTGHGYDVHRLVPGDGVFLCGHKIPHTHRLDGHSDADVGLHALTDAVLGALCEGDIGTHFPPTDPQWKGAASHVFAAHAAKRVEERGGRIVHVDVTIVAEAPKIGPHRPAMQTAVAACLGISTNRVSIKATTNEKMGFAGREEGIAALATATVELPVDEEERDG